MIKIKLTRASKKPTPWTTKEFKDWNEAIPEILKNGEPYFDIMIDAQPNENGEYDAMR